MISVIMPVYNNYSYLKESIDSILNQTYEDFEFIIIDDCSTEPIHEIIEEVNDPRIKFFKNEKNIGLTKSLNKCLDLVKGNLIARQDSDDISVKDRFEKQIKLFKDEIGLVSCYGYRFNENGRIKGCDQYLDKDIRVSNEEIKKTIEKQNRFLGAGSIYSKEVFKKIGYYDEKLYISQDYNYWLRILKYFDFKILKEELYFIRKHDKSVRKIHKEFRNVNIIKLCNDRANLCPIIKK